MVREPRGPFLRFSASLKFCYEIPFPPVTPIGLAGFVACQAAPRYEGYDRAAPRPETDSRTVVCCSVWGGVGGWVLGRSRDKIYPPRFLGLWRLRLRFEVFSGPSYNCPFPLEED